MPLTIYNKQINKISGPVAIRILKPNKTKFENYKKIGMTLPIYILFGDAHGSFANMCEVCECKPGSSNCCYKVYDPNFMRLIDKVISPGYSVDFYAEGWHFHNLDYNMLEDLDGPLPMVREAYTICYNRKLRGTQKYTDGCPTKQLKWHSVDVRQLYQESLEEKEAIMKYGKTNKYTFEAFCHFLQMSLPQDTPYILVLLTDKSEKISQITKVFDFMNKHYSSEQILKYCDVIDNLIDGTTPAMGLLKPNESLIMKQISKFPIEAQADWTSRIDSYLGVTFNKARREDAPVPDKHRLHKLISLIRSYIKNDQRSNSKFFSTMIKVYENTIFDYFNFETRLLDCYFMSRSIKPTLGGSSVLGITYFGDFHNKNISNFLINDFEYEIVLEQKEHKDKRCLDITSDINIDKILQEYGYTIPDTGLPEYLPIDVPQKSYERFNKPTPKPTPSPTPSYYTGGNKSYSTTRQTPVKRSIARRTPVKRSTARRTPVKRSTARRTPVKRSTARRTPVKRSTARRAPAKRSTARRAPAKRSTRRR